MITIEQLINLPKCFVKFENFIVDEDTRHELNVAEVTPQEIDFDTFKEASTRYGYLPDHINWIYGVYSEHATHPTFNVLLIGLDSDGEICVFTGDMETDYVDIDYLELDDFINFLENIYEVRVLGEDIFDPDFAMPGDDNPEVSEEFEDNLNAVIEKDAEVQENHLLEYLKLNGITMDTE